MSARYVLAADVGGTKTLLELGVCDGGGYTALRTENYFNDRFDGLAAVIDEFLATGPARSNDRLYCACLALAGPVTGRRVRLTNLPWEVDADELSQRFRIERIKLVNDFAAVGHGIPALGPTELRTLQEGRGEPQGVRAVLGAGTGLGMATLVWSGTGYRVLPSEGGNADFAPVNEVQSRLWSYLVHRLGRVWCGSILSGRGLERVYQFLSEVDTLRLRTSGGRAQNDPITAAEITSRAVEGSDPRATSALNLFLEVYGAVAGNLALTVMAHGGIYIAGGIAPRIAPLFSEGGFLRAFRAKGKFTEMMHTFPLHVVLCSDIGLRGAVAIAARIALKNE
jgi:glucokinase